MNNEEINKIELDKIISLMNEFVGSRKEFINNRALNNFIGWLASEKLKT